MTAAEPLRPLYNLVERVDEIVKKLGLQIVHIHLLPGSERIGDGCNYLRFILHITPEAMKTDEQRKVDAEFAAMMGSMRDEAIQRRQQEQQRQREEITDALKKGKMPW